MSKTVTPVCLFTIRTNISVAAQGGQKIIKSYPCVVLARAAQVPKSTFVAVPLPSFRIKNQFQGTSVVSYPTHIVFNRADTAPAVVASTAVEAHNQTKACAQFTLRLDPNCVLNQNPQNQSAFALNHCV